LQKQNKQSTFGQHLDNKQPSVNIRYITKQKTKKPLGLQQAIKKENKTTIKFLQGTNAVCNSSMQYGCKSRKKRKTMQASYW